ncbi:3-carboxymuconate cyclase [Dendryphion nanum]|uniref:3-carboxymuconate cyclase n=1 Tax=Dendryphion nanum TaxID=256645 RepID=A0A9P9DPU0_9PLEO|nr:3-carboxymuconate cyclase [Dendryphion nanum]
MGISHLAVALLAGTASACKYTLYATTFKNATSPTAPGTVVTLEFTQDHKTGVSSLKQVAQNYDCGMQPTWTTLSKGDGNKTTLECLDESWAGPNGSINALTSQDGATFKSGGVFTVAPSPVHIETVTYKSGEYRFLANFEKTAAGITVLKKTANGSFSLVQAVALPTGAQIHQTVLHPSREYLIAEDYGLGLHRVYSICGDSGKLTELKTEKAEAGVRHAAFSAPGGKFSNATTFMHSVNELENTITSFKVGHFEDGKGLIFTKVGSVSTYPGRQTPAGAKASEIVESDGFIIASNRNATIFKTQNPDPTNSTQIDSDSLATFKIDTDGKLVNGQLSISGGSFPRHFSLPKKDGSLIAVANQESNSITVYERDVATGKIGKALASAIKLPGGVSNVIWGAKQA